MSYRTLSPKISAELLQSLSPGEFILVALEFGFEQITERLAAGAKDDTPAWEFLMNRIRQVDAQRSAAAQR
jgi:hypothetical protein